MYLNLTVNKPRYLYRFSLSSFRINKLSIFNQRLKVELIAKMMGSHSTRRKAKARVDGREEW